MVKTKELISFAVTAKLICLFVFAYAKSLFSHNEAHVYSLDLSFLHEDIENSESDSYLTNMLRLSRIGRTDLRKYELRCEKTGLRGFRPDPTQNGLCSHRRWLEACISDLGSRRIVLSVWRKQRR